MGFTLILFGLISVSLCDHSMEKQNRRRLDLSSVNTSKASQELSSNEHICTYIHACHDHSSTDLVLLYVTSYVVLCNGLPVTCVLYGQFHLLTLPHCQCLYLKKLTSQRWVLHIVSIMEIVGRRVLDMRRGKRGQIRLQRSYQLAALFL